MNAAPNAKGWYTCSAGGRVPPGRRFQVAVFVAAAFAVAAVWAASGFQSPFVRGAF